jgi:hypothetical protein
MAQGGLAVSGLHVDEHGGVRAGMLGVSLETQKTSVLGSGWGDSGRPKSGLPPSAHDVGETLYNQRDGRFEQSNGTVQAGAGNSKPGKKAGFIKRIFSTARVAPMGGGEEAHVSDYNSKAGQLFARCACFTMDSVVLGLASSGYGCCMVRVFRQEFAL